MNIRWMLCLVISLVGHAVGLAVWLVVGGGSVPAVLVDPCEVEMVRITQEVEVPSREEAAVKVPEEEAKVERREEEPPVASSVEDVRFRPTDMPVALETAEDLEASEEVESPVQREEPEKLDPAEMTAEVEADEPIDAAEPEEVVAEQEQVDDVVPEETKEVVAEERVDRQADRDEPIWPSPTAKREEIREYRDRLVRDFDDQLAGDA